jgi:hypothetical protein
VQHRPSNGAAVALPIANRFEDLLWIVSRQASSSGKALMFAAFLGALLQAVWFSQSEFLA